MKITQKMLGYFIHILVFSCVIMYSLTLLMAINLYFTVQIPFSECAKPGTDLGDMNSTFLVLVLIVDGAKWMLVGASLYWLWLFATKLRNEEVKK